MAKFAGLVGFVTEEETNYGVWTATENIRQMQGDVISAGSGVKSSDKVNTDITLRHRISLVGDAFAYEHFYEIRWGEYAGCKWEVTSWEVYRPRITLTLGGIWRG